MIILDILIVVVFFIIGVKIKDRFKVFNRGEKKLLNKLFFYHMAFSIIFFFYVFFYGGDAQFYWEGVKEYSFSEILASVITNGRPTEIMLLLNYLPSNYLGLSFFTGNIIYGVVGYAAFVYFLAILKSIMPNYSHLKNIKVFRISVFPLILFLPNLHFWSAGVGKDTLLFFAIALFTYSIVSIKKRWFGLLISLLLSFFVRPHIALFLITGFGAGLIFSPNIKLYQRVFFSAVGIVVFSFLFTKVLLFVKLDEFSIESIEQFSDSKVEALSARGGSVVDITSYPYPLKVFTFLYRPFFYDINSPIALLASFENLLLLILSLRFISNKPLRAFKNGNYIIRGSLIFFLLGTLSFSLILGNLGIMLRQKNMFMLLFYLVILWGFYYKDVLPKLANKNGS